MVFMTKCVSFRRHTNANYLIRILIHDLNTVTDLINALPGNSSINTVQHATIEEALFFVDLTDAPVEWPDSEQVICVYCSSMSVPLLYE
jgi:hypothetical protein